VERIFSHSRYQPTELGYLPLVNNSLSSGERRFTNFSMSAYAGTS